MATSTTSESKNILHVKARKIFTLFLFSILPIVDILAQPVWVATTPSIGTTGALTIPVNYGIDRVGTVYICVENYNDPLPYSSIIVKNAAIAGPWAGRVATAVIPVAAGNINVILQRIFDVFAANTTHTIYIVAQDGGGVLQAVPIRFLCTTKPCPDINIFTFFGNTGDCINLGSAGMFQAAQIGALPTGVLKGTQWTVDWGDGTALWQYTSTVDNDIPGIQLHTYINITSCNYVGSWTVQNPCGKFANASNVFVVHGRDIPTDGDGLLRMEEVVTNTPDIVYVCEGKQHNITLADISTWNCQNPVVPIPLTAKPNIDPRTIQFTYGQTPAGAVMNTITGNVLIAGINIANGGGGWDGPVITGIAPPNPNTQTDVITIPATCVVGQRFYVYLKNWNKCNAYASDPSVGYEFQQFIIEIIDAPPAPIVTTPQNFCFGSVPATISATPNLPGNTLNWYGDAGLTIPLGTGLTLTHGKTAVGTYPFWVTETSGANGCEGPASSIDLVINPLPNKPTVAVTGSLTFCFDGGVTSVTLTANPNTPPAITSYQWYRNAVAVGGAITNAITLNDPSQNGIYTVRTFGINPTNCPSPLSDPLTVTIYSISNIVNPTPQTICELGTTTFTVSSTDAISDYSWEYSTDGGATWGNVNNGINFNGSTGQILQVVNAPLSFNGYQFRGQLKTVAGGCWFKSAPALLTVNAVPTANAGAVISRCNATPLGAITMTGATAGGTYSAVTWTGGGGLGGWTQNANPANATFTPTVTNGSFTATLTVTGSGTCLGTNPTSTRVISWSQTPIPTAGADISRCSATGTTAIAMTLATATGTYSAVTWSGGGGLGNWTQNANPALATFTPTTISGSFTATLTLTGSGACTGTNPASTRVVSWSQTPVATAGANISRCDATPLAAIAMTGATATGTYSAQVWSGGGGLGAWAQNANPALATFTPTVASGSFTATLTLTGSAACLGTNSASTRTIIWGQTPTANAGLDITRCDATPLAAIAMTGAVAGGSYSSVTWSGGGGLGIWVQNAVAANATFTPTTSSGSFTATLTVTGKDGCAGNNPADARIITWGQTPTAGAGANINRCDATPFAAIAMTGATATGSYSAATWTGGGGSGTWIQNINPALATFTPTVSSGSFTATLTVTGSAGCAGTNPTATRTVTWGQTPVAGAGGAISRCDATPTAVITMTGATATGTFSAVTWSGGGGLGAWTQNANPALATFTPTVNVGSFTATLTLTGSVACTGTNPTSTRTIDWGFLPTVSAGPDQSICALASATLAGSIGGGASTATWSGGGGAYAPNNTTLNAVYTPTAAERLAGTVTLTLTTNDPAGPCGAVNDNVIITIGAPLSSATLTGSGNACFGATSNISSVISGGAPPYTINYTRNGLVQPPITPYTSGTNFSLVVLPVGIYNYQITSVTDPCGNSVPPGGLPAVYTIIISANPVLTSPAPASQTICNDAFASIVLNSTVNNTIFDYTVSSVPAVGYSWTVGRDPVNGSITDVNGDGTETLTRQLQHNYTLPVTVTYTMTPKGPGATACPGASITRTVIVEPTPVISSPAKTICDNTSTAITVSTSTTTSNTTYYTWTVSAVGANITGAVSGPATGTLLATTIAQTLDNTGLTAQSVTYNITPWTGTAPGTLICSGTPIAVVVMVEPTPVISSPAKTICDNTSTAITVSTSTTTSNTTYYTWTVSAVGANITGASNGPASGTTIGTALAQTLDNTGATAQSVTYNITPRTGTAPGTLLCAGTPIAVVVTVEPTPVISSPAKTICDNTSTAITVSTSTTTSNISYYTWTVSAVGANITGASNGPATGTTIGTALAQTLDNTGATAQTVTYNITPRTGTAPGALLCSGAPIAVVVTVEPTPVISSPNKTICDNTGTGITVSASTTTSNTTYYTWTLGVVGANISGASAGGAIGTVLGTQINQTLDNTGLIAQSATYIITPWTGTAPGTLLCSGTSINVVVTVEPTPVISSPAKTICDNSSTAITVSTSTTTSNISYYTWTVSAVGANITGASNGPATGTTIGTALAQTLDNTGTTAQSVTYNITPRTGTAPGTLLCSGTPIAVVVTVEPTPVISSPSKTICDNTSTAITVSTSTTTSNTTYYTWTVSAVGANITGASSGPATGTLLATQISQTLDNTGATAQSVTYNITPWTGTAPGALLCSGTPIAVVVTVEPTPVISSPSKTICDNTSTAITVSTSTTTSNTTYYTWTVSAVGANITGASNGPATGTTIGTALAQTLDNTGATAQTVTYNITPRTGTAPGALLCSGTPIAVVVTVEPTPVANIVNSAAVICSLGNASINITSPSTTASPLLFDYTVSSTNPGATGGTAYIGGSNVTFPLNISGTLTNSSLTPLTVTYIVTPKAGLCTGAPVNTTVTVNPVPIINPNSQTICSNSIPSITISSNIAGTTYSWSVTAITGSITGTVVGNTGTGFVFTETLRNQGPANGTVTYRFTPTAPLAVGSCAGSPADIVITVRPEPVGTNAIATLCSGNALNYSLQGNINGNNSVPSVFTYTVTSSDALNVPPEANRIIASNNPITHTYINTTGALVTIIYTITPVSNPGGCTGSTFTYTVSVGAQPVLDPGLNKFACSNESIGLILKEAPLSLAPTDYDILTVTFPAGLSANAGNVTYPSSTTLTNYLSNDRYINTTTGNLVATYRVQPRFGIDCIGDPVDILITVHPPILGGAVTGNTSICYNSDAPNIPNAILASGGDGAITYSWYYTETLTAVPGDASWTLIPGAILSSYNPGILVNPTKFVRKAADGSCIAVAYSNMITININPLPVTSAISGPILLCQGATNRVYQVINTPGSTYTWTLPASMTLNSPQGLYFIIVDATAVSAPGDKISVVETFTATTGCVGLPVDLPITISPIIPGAVVAGPLQVCNGDAGVIYSVPFQAGSTYSWVVPAGASINTDPTLNQISVTFNMATTGPVSVVETSGSLCTTVHVPITVTVNPLPTVYNLTAPQAYCSGDPGVTITLSNSQTGVNYQLYNSLGIVGATVAGTTGSALTWLNNLSESYHVIATNAITGCKSPMNGTVVITINLITSGSIGTAQTICEGDIPVAFTSVAAGTGGGSISYQWQNSTDNITYSNIIGATSAVYSSPALTVDTWFRRIAISTLGSSVCPATSADIKVTVNNFVPGSISANQTICEGAIPAPLTSVTPTGDGIFTYQWKQSTDGLTFSDIGGAILETFAPAALTQDTWYKRVVTSTLLGKDCIEETNTVRITVINFAAGSIGLDQTICESTAPAPFTSVAPSGDGAFTYQWQNSLNGIAFADIPGATSATYAAGVLTVDTWYKRVVTSTLNVVPCIKETNIIKVTVNNFVPGSILADQTICESSVPAAFTSVTPAGDGAVTYQWQSSLDGISFSNITGATSETYSAGILLVDTWYKRLVTSTLNANTCTAATNTVQVIVVNFTAGAISAAQTICEGSAPAPLTATAPTGDGVFTYQWQNSTDGTTFGDLVGQTAATYAPGILIADTWYRRVVTSTLNTIPCIKETNVIKLTVNNFIPGSIGTDITICEGDNPSSLTSITPTGDGIFTYKWQNSIDNGSTYNDIVGAISETYDPGILIQDTWYKRVVTSTLSGNVCIKETSIVRITVDNFLPGSITTDQTICEGDIPAAFGSIVATGDGTFGYQWQISTNGFTFTDLAGATLDTYGAGALTQDTWFKRLATSTLNGTPCVKETNMIKVTVINFVPGTISADQTICNGTVPATFNSVAPSGDGVFTFQWQDSPDGITFNNIIGASSATYTSVALTADTYFRRVVTSTLNVKICVQPTNTVLVTVNNFVPGTILADQTICENSAPAAFTSITPAGDGTFTYQWQISLDGISFSNLTGATTETFGGGVLTQDTWYRRQVTSTLNANTCTLPTNIVKVTVVNFNAGSISASQTICEGTAPAAFTSVLASGDGAFTYQWQNSLDGITFNPIAGATLATYAPGVLIADTWYKRAVTSTLNAIPCVNESNVIRVTVNNFVEGSIGIDQTICDGTAPTPFTSVSPTGDGTFTYQWRSSTDNITFFDIPGAVGETYNAGILTQDTWYKRQVTSTLGGNSCMIETNTIRVTVTNFVPGSILTNQTICNGATPAAFTSIIPTGDGVFTYQWRNSLDGVVFNDIAGATLDTYSPPALTADTWYKRVVTSTFNATLCIKETNMVRVTVINFTPGSISMDQTICDGSVPVTFTSVNASGDGIFTYQWQDSPDGITFNNIGGATATFYTAAALTADTWYRRVVTSTLNLIPCTQITNEIKVTVVNFVPGSISAAQTICEGITPAVLMSVAPTGDGVFTFQWQNSLDGVSFSNITGAILDTYTPGALLQDTWYRLSVTSTLNSIPCSLMTNIIKVTVVNFTPGTISASQTICEATAPAAFTSAAPTGDGVFTFLWQESADGITFIPIAGATLATYAPGILAADTWYKRVVTSTLPGVPCLKETNVIKITVNNFVPGNIVTDQTICDGSVPVGFTSVTPTGDGVFTYQWQSSADGVIFADIPGAIFETYNSGPLVADTWYKRRVTSTLGINSCPKETSIIKVTVNNFLAGSISTAQTICEGSIPAAFVSVTPTGDGIFSYQWRSSTDGFNYNDIPGATAEAYSSGALLQDTWFKRVVISTLLGVPCTKETNSVRITVNNVQGGTIISDQTICTGSDPVTFISIVNGGGDGVISFQWQISTDGATFLDIAGAIAPNYDAPALAADRWYKRITKSLLNTVECTKESNIVKVTINGVTGGTITAAQTICYGTVPLAITSTDDGTGSGVVTYQWQQSDNNVTWSNISGANTFGYAPAALISDKFYKRIIISILNGIVCTSESNVIKITVNPLPVAVLTGGETICPAQTSILNVNMMVGTGPFEIDIENYPGVTITGYVSGANIVVSPAVTTTYKLLRVRDSNGCEVLSPSGNLNGTATVVVSTPPAIATFTPSPAVCEFTLATFRVTAIGTNPTYQWFVNEGAGFIPVADGGTYFGATTPTLQIFNTVRTMNGYIYHVVVSGCSTGVTSADAVFTVNTAPELTLHPSDSTVCLGNNATMEADGTGTSVTWQWYVNKGAGFVVVVNDANFSGATTKILTITNALSTFNNWIFRARATGICGVPAFTNFGRLSVINPPTAGLQPTARTICENGSTSFLGNGSGYLGLQWQVFTGGIWTNITDDAIYAGSATNQLTIMNAPVTFNGNQYRLGLIGGCAITYSNAAILTVNANPVVDFTAIDPIFACGGVPIVINGNPTGGSGTYTQHRWTGDVGPLNNYIIQSPTFNSQISGTYNLNYRVTDSNGCTANDDLAVIVDSPSADFNQDINNGCTPLTVTFTKDMTGITSFSWDFGDGSPVETAIASPVHIFTNTNPSSIGYYDVKLTVLSPGGCFDTFTSMIIVYPEIDATFTAVPAIVCSGNQINFTTLPGASKYFWDFGDGISGYFTNSTNHLYTNLTNATVVHTVKLTTTSFYNCTDVRTLDITVMPTPLPQFTALPVSQIYNAAGNPVTFTNTTNTGTWTWLWKFGDGSTSTDQNPVHVYTTLGTFNVVLRVNNANCSDSVKHSVTVSPIPPVANFDLIPSGCSPLEIIINNTSLNTNTPGTTYMWDFGDGGASTSKNPSYVYTTPGIFRVELVVTAPGGTSNYSQVVNSYPSPKANFELTPKIVFANDEMVRMFNLTPGENSYLWEFGDGDTSKVKDPSHKYLEEGVYDITLWAYRHNVINGETVTCSDKYVLTSGVTVEPAGVIRFSTVFTPNLSGPIEMDHLPTGGIEIDQFFYPPIREKVTNYMLQVFNRLGVLIFESHDINIPWNGYYHGKLCTQGVYVWYVEGKYANGRPFKKVGDVTLLH